MTAAAQLVQGVELHEGPVFESQTYLTWRCWRKWRVCVWLGHPFSMCTGAYDKLLLPHISCFNCSHSPSGLLNIVYKTNYLSEGVAGN